VPIGMYEEVGLLPLGNVGANLLVRWVSPAVPMSPLDATLDNPVVGMLVRHRWQYGGRSATTRKHLIRIMNDLSFDRIIFNTVFDSLHRHIFNFGFGNHLRIVFCDIFDGIIVCVSTFDRHLLDSPAIFLLNNFSLIWDVFCPLHWFVFYYRLFVGDIFNTALAYTTFSAYLVSRRLHWSC
jgi:hypothetical protein